MCKTHERPPHQKSSFSEQRYKLIFRYLSLKKSLKMFITEYISDARFIMTVIDGSIF